MQVKQVTLVQSQLMKYGAVYNFDPIDPNMDKLWFGYKNNYSDFLLQCQTVSCLSYAALDIANLSAFITEGSDFMGKTLNISESLLEGPDDPSTPIKDHVESALRMVATSTEEYEFDAAVAGIFFPNRRPGEVMGLFEGVPW